MNTVNVRGLEIGAGRPKIAVSLTGAAREDLIAQARALPGLGADLAEWRMDCFAQVENSAAVEACLRDLRRSLGIVLQDTHLFTGTVMENIRYGRLDATDEECMAAAGLANADSFIRRLPDGYDTLLTHDGSQLSQGQRQLIAIARAAVADPPVLILDEATSSIDTRTEALVQRGMDALMKGRTSFVIAHRLSTVRNADCIMVLEHGRIIERGTHDSLMEQRDRYYQLYTGSAVG